EGDDEHRPYVLLGGLAVARDSERWRKATRLHGYTTEHRVITTSSRIPMATSADSVTFAMA
ncbi:MAG TPA: hypothetical protein VNZ58_09185, partial [Thermomicrobiales bacterium]|nr:hypothetical protein [Thermomicrobiales bacterium]